MAQAPQTQDWAQAPFPALMEISIDDDDTGRISASDADRESTTDRSEPSTSCAIQEVRPIRAELVDGWLTIQCTDATDPDIPIQVELIGSQLRRFTRSEALPCGQSFALDLDLMVQRYAMDRGVQVRVSYEHQGGVGALEPIAARVMDLGIEPLSVDTIAQDLPDIASIPAPDGGVLTISAIAMGAM